MSTGLVVSEGAPRTVGDIAGRYAGLRLRLAYQRPDIFIIIRDEIERGIAILVFNAAERNTRQHKIAEAEERALGAHLRFAPASSRLSTMYLRISASSMTTARWSGVAFSIRFIGSTSHSSWERMCSRTSVDPSDALRRRGGVRRRRSSQTGVRGTRSRRGAHA